MPTQLIRDGSQVVAKDFPLPDDTVFLESGKKRTLTICNLFFNHHLPIEEVARALDEDHGTVIGTLIEHQFDQRSQTETGNATCRCGS